jgi:hypothetical protein
MEVVKVSKEHNPEIQCDKCGLIFVLLGDHKIKTNMRFRCPSIDCNTILIIKPKETGK